MATIREQLAKAQKITPERLSKDLFKFIKSIEKEILDLEKKRISEDSKDIFGKPIGFYSFFTDHLTNGAKKAGDPFTGKDTGKWFDGFYMQEVSGVLRFGSRDPKTNDILNSEHWLSDELFGLSDKQLEEVIRERLLPFFIKNIRDILDL